MSINTELGNPVKFLGLNATLRANLLKAILGCDATGSVSVNPTRQCWVGLSSTDPAVSVTEPLDDNYERVRLGANGVSDYLTITGASAVNSGHKEIKFKRSLGPWAGSYPWFVLYNAETNGTLMAWGELATAITVTAQDVVPLFEEEKFRLYFPAPGEVEGLANGAA